MNDPLLAPAYMSELVFEGDTLTITAKGSAGKIALGASSRVIPLVSISALEFREAKTLTNGQLRIVTDEGMTLVHFLKKHQAALRAFVTALQQGIEHRIEDTAKAPLASAARLRAASNRAAYDQLRSEQTTRLAALKDEFRRQFAQQRASREEFLLQMASNFERDGILDSQALEPQVVASRMESYVNNLIMVSESDLAVEASDHDLGLGANSSEDGEESHGSGHAEIDVDPALQANVSDEMGTLAKVDGREIAKAEKLELRQREVDRL